MIAIETEGTAHVLSIRRERWFQRKIHLIQWLTLSSAVLDFFTGMIWVWSLNILPILCLWGAKGQLENVANLSERTWVVSAALTCCATGFVELAGGITRITTDYEHFLFCDSQDYTCQTLLGSVNVAVSAVWLTTSLLWVHIITRAFRPGIWIRWNPTAPILFLSGIAMLLVIIGGAYQGWIFNLLCLACQWTGRKPESDQIHVHWYTTAATMALISTMVQSITPLKEIWADQYHGIYCEWISYRHFNCGEDLDAVCIAGAVCWLIVSILCWRLVCCRDNDATVDYDEEYASVVTPSPDEEECV